MKLRALITATLATLGGAVLDSLRTLIVADSATRLDKYDPFIRKVREGGFIVETTTYDSPTAALDFYGDWRYGNVIILGGAISDFPPLDSRQGFTSRAPSFEEYLRFFDDGGNLLIVAEADIRKDIRRLAKHCGVSFEVDGSRLYDFNSSPNGKTLELTPEKVGFAPLSGAARFTASSIRTNFINNPNTQSLVNAPETSVLKIGEDQVAPLTKETRHGSEASIATVTFSEKNSRAVFVSSLSLFRDVEKSEPNWELARELVWWSAGRKRELRASAVRHSYVSGRVGVNENGMYSEGDIVRFEVEIEENLYGIWHPHTKQIGFEITRESPAFRGTMLNDGTATHYVEVELPDLFGVYHFEINHQQPYYNPLKISQQVTVRNKRHDDHTRFPLIAYPYYVSMAVCIICTCVFVFYFLSHKDDVVCLDATKKND